MFDFRDYPRDSKLFDPANKKVIGKMKNEFKTKIISGFVGLKSKMYALVDVDGKENKKAKVVNRGVVRGIRHNELVDVLYGRKLIRPKMKWIQSKLHRIGTYHICNISLSCFDDERYILHGGINSLDFFQSILNLLSRQLLFRDVLLVLTFFICAKNQFRVKRNKLKFIRGSIKLVKSVGSGKISGVNEIDRTNKVVLIAFIPVVL